MPISHVVSCNNMIRKLWNVEAKYVLSMLPHFPALSMHSEWRKKKGQTHWYLYLAIISFFRLVSVNWEPFLLGSSLYAILKCDEVCYKKQHIQMSGCRIFQNEQSRQQTANHALRRLSSFLSMLSCSNHRLITWYMLGQLPSKMLAKACTY